MRKILSLISILLFGSSLWAQECSPGFKFIGNECTLTSEMTMGFFTNSRPSDECGKPQESYKKAKRIIDRVRESYSTGDEWGNIRSLRTFSKKCNIDLQNKFGIDEGQIKIWENKANSVAVNKLKEKIDNSIIFGEAENLIYRYESLAKNIGQPLNPEDVSKMHLKNKEIQLAEEKSCTAVDMRPAFGPVRDQDSIGWCYAFVAADLLSYKTGKKISPMDVAVSFNDRTTLLKGLQKRVFDKTEADFDGGTVEPAISAAIQKGLCLDKNISSDDMGQTTLKKAIQSVEQLRSSQSQSKKLAMGDCDLTGFKKLFPSLEIKNLQEIIEKSTQDDFINKIVDKACEPRIKPDSEIEIESKNLKTSSTEKKKEAFKEIDRQLNQSNPISIGVYSKLFLANEGSEHAMTIVGREWDSKQRQCLYIVRNSWGASCRGLNSVFEKCDQGNIYIPKSRLIPNSTDFQYIK